jgi:hypothetical protein
MLLPAGEVLFFENSSTAHAGRDVKHAGVALVQANNKKSARAYVSALPGTCTLDADFVGGVRKRQCSPRRDKAFHGAVTRRMSDSTARNENAPSPNSPTPRHTRAFFHLRLKFTPN